MAEVREGMKIIREKIRKVTRERKILKKEVERIKGKWRIREENWIWKGKNLREGIEKIELERIKIGRMEEEGREERIKKDKDKREGKK